MMRRWEVVGLLVLSLLGWFNVSLTIFALSTGELVPLWMLMILFWSAFGAFSAKEALHGYRERKAADRDRATGGTNTASLIATIHIPRGGITFPPPGTFTLGESRSGAGPSSGLNNDIVVPEVPDRIEPVVGFRVWSHDVVNSKLRSYAGWNEAVWPKEGLKAECQCEAYNQSRLRMFLEEKSYSTAQHPFSPHPHGTCGIYATTSIGMVASLFHGRINSLVVGAVKGWGKVIEGEKGWRAEYAAPIALYGEIDDLITIGQEYDIPVYNNLLAFIKEIGVDLQL